MMHKTGETEGGDAITRFWDPGLPSENWVHNRGYLARIGSWKEKLPSRSGTTEKMRGDIAQSRRG